MIALRHRCLLSPLLLAAFFVACEHVAPVEPAIQAAFAAGSGSTPSAPSGANAVAVSESRIDVSWQDNSTNETGFEMHRSTAGGPFTLRASTGAGVTSFGDLGLSHSTRYCYRIRAFRTSGKKTTYSPFSSVACSTTLAPPPPPGPPNVPSWINAWPVGSTAASVSWDDNSANEDGFRVQRSTDGGASWLLAGTLSAGTTQFDDGGLESEQQVCYRVIAFNSEGESLPSPVGCARGLAGPTDLALDAQGNLTWTDNSAIEDGYEVWMMDAYGVAYDGLVASLPANSTSFLAGGCENVSWCWGYAVMATKDGGYSDYAAVITRSQ